MGVARTARSTKVVSPPHACKSRRSRSSRIKLFVSRTSNVPEPSRHLPGGQGGTRIAPFSPPRPACFLTRSGKRRRSCPYHAYFARPVASRATTCPLALMTLVQAAVIPDPPGTHLVIRPDSLPYRLVKPDPHHCGHWDAHAVLQNPPDRRCRSLSRVHPIKLDTSGIVQGKPVLGNIPIPDSDAAALGWPGAKRLSSLSSSFNSFGATRVVTS